MLHVIVNPMAGRVCPAHVRTLRTLAARHAAPFVVSRSAEHLRDAAHAAAAHGAERVIVAGGDGTIHHVGQALIGTATALAIVPLGRGNDLACSLGVPQDVKGATARAIHGNVRRIDVAGIRTGNGVATFAVGYCGLGFDTEVARIVNRFSRFRGRLLYLSAVLRTLARFEPLTMEVSYDGGRFDGLAMFVVAANAPRFGGGMLIAPDAVLDDGLVDLVVIRPMPPATLLRLFTRVYRGGHTSHPAVSIHRTRALTIAVHRDTWLYGGGEPIASVPADSSVTIEAVPGALSVVT